MTARRAAVILTFLALAAPSRVRAQEWPQWRGPGRDGVARAFQAPAQWPATLKRVWRTPVGEGHASPVVAGDRAYVHTRKGQKELVSCVDLKTGKILWGRSYAAPSFKSSHYAKEEGNGPYATPAVRGDRLYTYGLTAILSCFDTRDGKLVWRKDFSDRVASTERFCGTAASPLMEGNHIIIQAGDDRHSEVMALDAATGAPKWRWQEKRAAYASPVVAEFAGVRQIIALSDASVVGLAPASGELLWRMPRPSMATACSQNIATPVVFPEGVILSGKETGTIALRVTKANGKWEVSEIWNNAEVAVYRSNMVFDGGRLYGFSWKKSGQFFCLDAATGKAAWLSDGRQGDNAILLSAAGALLCFTEGASLAVIAGNAKEFKPIAHYTVADSPVWAHPALLAGQFLVKDAATLALLSLD